MTRHGKNQTSSACYSYAERKKDREQSGFGCLHERLGADSIKEFDCCSLTLQPCREPVVSPEGFVYDKESILEFILNAKKENVRKLKEWERQRRRDETELEELAKAEDEAKAERFRAQEGTPAHPGLPNEVEQAEEDHATTSDLCFKKKNLSFWVPELQATAAKRMLEKPSQKVLCPMTGKVLKMKDLLPIKFTPIVNDESTAKMAGRTQRYMCPITHDILTNSTPCAVLKKSGCVVTMDCVERIIKKDWIDPLTNDKITESDIIELQRGGTGYAKTNKNLKAKLNRPEQQLA